MEDFFKNNWPILIFIFIIITSWSIAYFCFKVPWISSISFVASVVTIMGFYLIYKTIKDQKTSKERQRIIILDLFRHFFINAAIMEVIRMKMSDNWEKLYPQEGTFLKFCVLETDLQLDQIKVKDKDYTVLHSLSLYLRNYNIMAEVAEKHFNNPHFDSKEKENDLNDLWIRTKKISDNLKMIGNFTNLNIKKDDLKESIKKRVEEKMVGIKPKVDIKILRRDDIPKRVGLRDYYDRLFEDSTIFDDCIIAKYNEIRMLSFASSKEAHDPKNKNNSMCKKYWFCFGGIGHFNSNGS